MDNPTRTTLVMIALLTLIGCTVSTDTTVVATPPAMTGKIKSTSGEEIFLPRAVAMLPFVNKTDSEFAYTVVRRAMFNHFASKNYRMLHWRDVDNRLRLAGYEDSAAIDAVSPARLMNLLGVDGLIYGSITHYGKTFAGIYAQVSVGVELRFINSADQIVWAVKDIQHSHAGGLSTTPVGLLVNALASANYLRGDINLYRTADELGRELAEAMPEPAALSQRAKPHITDVVHSGVGHYLKYGDTLEIGIEGDAGKTAAARIEGIGVVDLEEVEPGQYIGKVAIGKKDNAEDVEVVGVLQDSFGLSATWISPYGLLNVDNLPPGRVTAIRADSKDGAVQLAWQGPPDADVASYHIDVRSTERGQSDAQYDTDNASYVLAGLRNFRRIYVSITASDRAGNRSAETQIAAIAAPDPRFGSAADLPSVLPASISGVSRLTRAGSPYFLRNDSRLGAAGALLVAPGVRIAVSPRVHLAVLGELQVYGSMSDPVNVEGDNGQAFERFLLLESRAPVRIEGLHVEGGGLPIEIVAGAPLIANSVIENAQFNALSISGASRPVIRNCQISGAKAAGVIVSDQAQPTFIDNRFVDNEPFHIQNGSSYQIDARQNRWEPAASAQTILGDVTY